MDQNSFVYQLFVKTIFLSRTLISFYKSDVIISVALLVDNVIDISQQVFEIAGVPHGVLQSNFIFRLDKVRPLTNETSDSQAVLICIMEKVVDPT